MTGVIVLVVVVLLVVGLLAYLLVTYNTLVRQKNQCDAAWAQIDVQLKRRHDLIPNLVETVQGYAGHERSTLEAVVAARQGAVAAAGTEGPAGLAAAENGLTRALGRLFAVAEAYPDLKANQNFLQLQTELAGTEDKIAYARQFFNNAVQTINTTVQTVPSNLVAKLGGFKEREYFEAVGDERAAASVRF